MVILVKFLGIFIVIMAASYIVKPEIMKQYLAFWTKDNSRIYAGGLLAILIGIVLLIGASQCALPTIVVIIGILSLVKGVVLFTPANQKLMSWANNLMKKPLTVQRLIALMSLTVGILLISAA